MERKSWTYREAGVDIDAGNEVVRRIQKFVKQTHRSEVIGDLGGFGGLFAFPKERFQNPVLVAATDGVGTKLKIAFVLGRHNTVGVDVVAMCVNDLLVQGAEPLFFLDYLAVGKLQPSQVAEIVSGIAAGCRQANCALIGGETAEMPGFYKQGEYDLAGFAIGVVERDQIIDGSAVRQGDILLGLASSGLHSNGYSLVRKVLLEEGGENLSRVISDLSKPLGEELLTPTRIYVPSVSKVLREFRIHGMAHITGGGLPENTARILPSDTDAVFYKHSWEVPPVFDLVQKVGAVPEPEMYRTFNMGIGFILVVSAADESKISEQLTQTGERVFKIGEIVTGEGKVRFVS